MRTISSDSSGIHLLSCPQVVADLVSRSGVGTGDLVIDFGAGPGTLTAPLAATGARVLAVELDARFVSDLHHRFDDRPLVRVVHDDLRTVRLPRRAFAVVANLPFTGSTQLLRRLLTPASGGFSRAELVVEWGLAMRLTAACPRDLESAWWASRFTLTVRRRIPARCFRPAPRVDAAHLGIRPRSEVDRRTSEILWALLSTAYGRPAVPARSALNGLAPRKLTHRLLKDQPAPAVRTGQWLDLARMLAAEKNVVPPFMAGARPAARRTVSPSSPASARRGRRAPDRRGRRR